jgi:hypothetical protein
VDLGKGIVACIGIDASKKLLSDIEGEMKKLLKAFDNQKFDDMREFVIKRAS